LLIQYIFSYFNDAENAASVLIKQWEQRKCAKSSNRRLSKVYKDGFARNSLADAERTPPKIIVSASIMEHPSDLTYFNENTETRRSMLFRRNGSDISSTGSLELKNETFKAAFAFAENENLITCTIELISAMRSYYLRALPLYGKIYISTNYICFKSSIVGLRAKVVVPIADIREFQKVKALNPLSHILKLTTNSHEEIFFDLYTDDDRECLIQLLRSLQSSPSITSPSPENPMYI
jgi:hypothetical protein